MTRYADLLHHFFPFFSFSRETSKCNAQICMEKHFLPLWNGIACYTSFGQRQSILLYRFYIPILHRTLSKTFLNFNSGTNLLSILEKLSRFLVFIYIYIFLQIISLLENFKYHYKEFIRIYLVTTTKTIIKNIIKIFLP